MGSRDRAVDHRVFIVRVGGQQGKDRDPYTAFGPAAPAAVSVVPIAKAFGKVTPGGTGAVPMYHRVDESTVIRRRHADGARPSWQLVLDQVPLVIAELVGARGSAFVEADIS
jgi:hypothetical protein